MNHQGAHLQDSSRGSFQDLGGDAGGDARGDAGGDATT